VSALLEILHKGAVEGNISLQAWSQGKYWHIAVNFASSYNVYYFPVVHKRKHYFNWFTVTYYMEQC